MSTTTALLDLETSLTLLFFAFLSLWFILTLFYLVFPRKSLIKDAGE